MDFLDRVFLDNSIRSYLTVGGTILIMLLIKRYLSRYIAWFLCRIFSRIWKTFDKQSFTSLVVQPLDWLLFIVIAIFAIDKLNFPSDLHFKIYGHAIEEITDKIGIAIIIIAFTRFLLRIIDFIALVLEQRALKTQDKSDDQLVIFLRDFLKVIVGIIGVLMLLKACFNQPITGLLTSLSIVGAAVALAAKESLENLIASFIIFFDKPFRVDDTVKVNAVTGTVERIGLRSTRIRTADKTLVTVPNKQMVDSVVDNWSMRTQRRGEFKLELSPATTAIQVQQLIDAVKKILSAKTGISSSSVFLTDINKNGITVAAEYFTEAVPLETFNLLKEEIGFAVKKILEDQHVALTAAANTVTIINESREG
ncbi:MAG: mechanosensitive ion channel family protein [Ferruginibacter sp.]